MAGAAPHHHFGYRAPLVYAISIHAAPMLQNPFNEALKGLGFLLELGKRMTDEIWGDNLLNRKADAEHILRFLRGRLGELKKAGKTQSYVLNIDAEWGFGKTHFLERFAKMLRKQGYMVAEVNAWETDHAVDPLLAAMAAIEDAFVAPGAKSNVDNLIKRSQPISRKIGILKNNLGPLAVAAGKGLVAQTAKRLAGETLERAFAELTEEMAGSGDVIVDAVERKASSLLSDAGTDQLNEFRASQKAIGDFRTNLGLLAAELAANDTPMPLFVLVDELDRCRPSYAIAMLERIKHVFSSNDVVFIVATNTKELSNSIKAVYGAEFNGTVYLRRFFDRTYHFGEPDHRELVAALMAAQPLPPESISSPKGYTSLDVVQKSFVYWKFTPRDIVQAYDLLHTVVTTWEQPTPLELALLVPLVVAQHKSVPTQTGGRLDIKPLGNLEHFHSANALYELSGYDHRIQQNIENKISPLELAQILAGTLREDLRTLEAAPNQGEWWKHWSRQRVRDDILARRTASTSTHVPQSYMTGYADLVRMAGRFRAPQEKEDQNDQ